MPPPVARLRFSCPSCGESLMIPAEHGGRNALCPVCRAEAPAPQVEGLETLLATAPAEAPLPPGQRTLRVRRPASEAERMGRSGRTEPPRLPKPAPPGGGEPSPFPQSSSPVPPARPPAWPTPKIVPISRRAVGAPEPVAPVLADAGSVPPLPSEPAMTHRVPVRTSFVPAPAALQPVAVAPVPDAAPNPAPAVAPPPAAPVSPAPMAPATVVVPAPVAPISPAPLVPVTLAPVAPAPGPPAPSLPVRVLPVVPAQMSAPAVVRSVPIRPAEAPVPAFAPTAPEDVPLLSRTCPVALSSVFPADMPPIPLTVPVPAAALPPAAPAGEAAKPPFAPVVPRAAVPRAPSPVRRPPSAPRKVSAAFRLPQVRLSKIRIPFSPSRTTADGRARIRLVNLTTAALVAVVATAWLAGKYVRPPIPRSALASARPVAPPPPPARTVYRSLDPLTDSGKPAAAHIFTLYRPEENFTVDVPEAQWTEVASRVGRLGYLEPVVLLERSAGTLIGGGGSLAICVDILPEQADPVVDPFSIPTVQRLSREFGALPPDTGTATSVGALRLTRLSWPGQARGIDPVKVDVWFSVSGHTVYSFVSAVPARFPEYLTVQSVLPVLAGFRVDDPTRNPSPEMAARRDMQGATSLAGTPPPNAAFDWRAVKDSVWQTWPGGAFATPGAVSTGALGTVRVAAAAFPADGFPSSGERIVRGLQRVWPLLARGELQPVPADPAYPVPHERFTGTTTLGGQPASVDLRLFRNGPDLVVLCGTAGAQTPPLALTTALQRITLRQPGRGDPMPVNAEDAQGFLHRQLLTALATEADADGRDAEASAIHLTLFRRYNDLSSLAFACQSLAADGRPADAEALLNSEGVAFEPLPGWALYRTLVLAAVGAGEAAHAGAMDLLAAGAFNSDATVPYLESLIATRCWPQAKAFASMLVRVDPAPVWRLYYATILENTGERDKAVKIIQTVQDSWPEDSALGMECVQTLVSLNLLPEAAEAAARLSARHPQREDALLLLASCQAALGHPDAARKAWMGALAVNPSSPVARTSLQALAASTAQSDDGLFAPWLEAVPLPPDIASALPEVSAIPADLASQPAVTLYRVTTLRHQRGRPLLTTTRVRTRIQNADGMSSFNTLTFPVLPGSQRLCIHAIRVLGEDGRVLSEASLRERYTTGSPDGAGQTVHVPVPGLAPGCQLDYAYTVETNNLSQGLECTRHLFALQEPCLSDVWCITGDVKKLKWSHTTGAVPQQSDGRLVWKQEPAALLTWSAVADDKLDALPALHIGSVLDTWAVAGQDYLESIRHRLTPDPAVQKLAAAKTKDVPAAGRVAALARFVRDDISYTAIENGTRALIPNAAGRTVANRYGDCKDHAVLLQQLLLSTGVQARLALIRGTGDIDPDFPGIGQFDHMIVAVPAAGGQFDFIDCTDKFSEPLSGMAPARLADRFALILDGAESRLVRTPATCAPAEIHLARSVSPLGEYDALITDDVTLTGSVAASYRGVLAPAAPVDRIRLVRRAFDLDGLRDQLTDVRFSALTDPATPLRITLTWQARGCQRRNPGGVSLNLPTPVIGSLLFPVGPGGGATAARRRTFDTRLDATITVVPSANLAARPSVATGTGMRGVSPHGRWEVVARPAKGPAGTLVYHCEIPATTAAAGNAPDQFPWECLSPLRTEWQITSGSLAER